MLKLGKGSHLDHGLTSAQLEWLLARFATRNEFFIATEELPENLGTVESLIWGPIVGDNPVEEMSVFYQIRNGRPCASRMVKRPPRRTSIVTVVAGPTKDEPCVLYTAYGGPAAPREPGDTSIPCWEGPGSVLESRAFWREHALAAT